jgi:hypothetical protein
MIMVISLNPRDCVLNDENRRKLSESARNNANKFDEFLVEGRIPSEAVKWIDFTWEFADVRREHTTHTHTHTHTLDVFREYVNSKVEYLSWEREQVRGTRVIVYHNNRHNYTH